jgi:hypothetical protein
MSRGSCVQGHGVASRAGGHFGTWTPDTPCGAWASGVSRVCSTADSAAVFFVSSASGGGGLARGPAPAVLFFPVPFSDGFAPTPLEKTLPSGPFLGPGSLFDPWLCFRPFRRLRFRCWSGGIAMSSPIRLRRPRLRRWNASSDVTARVYHRPSCPSSSAMRASACSTGPQGISDGSSHSGRQISSANGSRAHLARARRRCVRGSCPRSTTYRRWARRSARSWRLTRFLPHPRVAPSCSRVA